MPKKKTSLLDTWSQESQEVWANLKPIQQEFLTEWISNGFNGSQAYKTIYNDKANDGVARVGGSQVLASTNVKKIVEEMSKTNAEELILIKKVYIKSLDSDNESIQLKGAESLAKLNGELIDRTKVEHSGKIDTEMDVTKLTDAELLQLKALREKME